MTTSSKRELRLSYWQKHIKGWQHCNLSQRGYCQEHGLSLSSFGYWHRKLKISRAKQPEFHPLAVPASINVSSTKNGSGLRLHLNGDKYCIEVGNDFSSATLKKIIASIEGM